MKRCEKEEEHCNDKGIFIFLSYLAFSPLCAQRKYAVMDEVPITSVKWTGGFWGERFNVFSHTSVQSMWATWQSDQGKGWNNFLVAAGEKEGEHHGPPFHDG